MQNKKHKLSNPLPKPAWVTIKEAVKITNELTGVKMMESDIYRYALHGEICLSVYFQSPPVLRKIKNTVKKFKMRQVENSLQYRLCMLDTNGFLNGHDLILSTEGKYISPNQLVINTELHGYEFVLIQKLLAHSLKLHKPVTGANQMNYGITVNLSGQTYQVFEKTTWQRRINKQIIRLPKHIISEIYSHDSIYDLTDYSRKGYFPIYDLPKDACFVIRQEELDKFLSIPKEKYNPSTPNRISTPLSRLFWLACKNNDLISPLLSHPYKLLPIFEHWASVNGITDNLSGDTLKRALERGSPSQG
ncbi:hypothetical protein [Citrobacter koseri]|uniref:hypothetical protein n=1 Tax=Citrobacter koseri TaxID=545 RepID=UPI001C624EC1|nr:hypothetical protein [Citrobacter koseri]QYG86340.1 hypothetical protein NCK_19700 [Citrobacter koseri]